MNEQGKNDLNEKRRVAKLFLRAFVAKTDNQDLKQAVYDAIGAGSRGTRNGTVAMGDALRDALLEAGNSGLSEMAVFMKFKIGRPEMTIKCRNFIKVEDTEDRLWVAFDEKDECYKVVGEGSEMPDDWQGYIPADYATL